jgi:hypothetical protein
MDRAARWVQGFVAFPPPHPFRQSHPLRQDCDLIRLDSTVQRRIRLRTTTPRKGEKEDNHYDARFLLHIDFD